MTLFIVTFVCFAIVIAAMAVGVAVTGRQIKGSCGGLNGIVTNDAGEQSCGVCGMPAEELKAKGGCGEDKPTS